MSTDTPIEKIDPAKTALLVMDFQNGHIGIVDNGDDLVQVANNLIRTFREHGGHIGYVRVAFTEEDLANVKPTGRVTRRINMMGGAAPGAPMHADSDTTQIHTDIAPQDGDIVVRKTRVGPFRTTDLYEQLQARGIDTLVLAGIATSGVVLSAVRDAHDEDYRIVVLEDLCADPDPEVHRVLVEKIFPSQADVTSVREFHGLLH